MKLNILKYKKLLIAILIIAAAGAAISGFTKKKTAEVKDQPKNVKVAKASNTSLVTEVAYASKLKSTEETSISPKNSGKVTSVNVKVGDTVEKGKVLFTLDSAELKAQLDQQQANLNASKASLEKTRGSAIDQQVIQANQTYKTCEITYNDSKDYYEKMQKLYDASAISKQDLDNSQSKFNNAEIALNAARDNLNLITEKSGPQSVEVAEAQVKQSEAAVNLIKAQLDNSTITSPISGVVSAVNIHEGEISSSSNSAVTVIDSKSLIAEVNVPDSMLSKIQTGQTVPVNINSLKDKDIKGTIDNISPAADSKTQAYIVKIKIDNSNGDIKPGMFSKVMLPAEKKDNILAVPNESIKIENNVSYLYIVENGKVKKLSVNTGLSNGKITEITSSSIKSGYNIITEGQLFLNDGEKVNIAK